MRRALPFAAIGLALVGACTLVTTFDPARLEEKTEALCGDGVDNDGDGLADCQDFKCLDQPVCCDRPRVFIDDAFDAYVCAADSCDRRDGTKIECLDQTVWEAWGAPYPIVCDGALVPRKLTQCYDIGVLSRAALPLRPGLRVVAGITGQPEPTAHLGVSLTTSSEATGALDECGSVRPIDPLLGLLQVATGGGFQITASFDARQVGASAVVADGDRHEVEIRIATDRRVHYLLDGVEFAASPGDMLVPAAFPDVHVALHGRGLTPRFTDVRVTAGSQCETPGGWQQDATFLALRPASDESRWDYFQVSSPAVVAGAAGAVNLFYTGCLEKGGACDPLSLGLGLAVSHRGQPFERVTDTAPLLFAEAVAPETFSMDVTVAADASPPTAYVTNGKAIYAYDASDLARGLQPLAGGAPVLQLGAVGDWDDAAICCAAAVARAGGVDLFYAGQHGADANPTWRIGLATADAGGVFTKHPASPVLREGALEDFDGRGVTEPAVIYDDGRALYRMWYGARAFLGITAIGYAVSPDGVVWTKYPGNPVVTQDALGLEAIGRPAVLADEADLHLWLHGLTPGSAQLAIFALDNQGVPSP
jgi:hypothetical protein